MKKIIILFSFLIFFSSCDKEETEVVLTKNATIYIDKTEVDNCMYSVKTDDNEFYATKVLPGLNETANFRARITYTLTDGTINCGFGGYLTEIKISNIVKI